MILKLTKLEMNALLASIKDDVKMSNPEYMSQVLDNLLTDVPPEQRPNLWQRREMLDCANDQQVMAQFNLAKNINKFISQQKINNTSLNLNHSQLLEIVKYIEIDIKNHRPLTDQELKETYSSVIVDQINDSLLEQNLPTLNEMDPKDADDLFQQTMDEAIYRLKQSPIYNKSLTKLTNNPNLKPFLSIKNKILILIQQTNPLAE